jgi:prophage maintenance system killer protein
MENNYAIVKFTDNDFELDVRADKSNYTVWLTQRQMAELFLVNTDTIGLHIRNILKDKELDNSTTEDSSVVQVEGKRTVRRSVKIYNLDMIISVGYRIKSQRGIVFRQWANKVLKEFLIEGYSVNKKRLAALDRVVEVQNRMLASALNIDEIELRDVIDKYTNALDILDDYDHQRITKPSGNVAVYRLNYDDCRKIIDSMRFSSESQLFGVEKENGKLNGILEAVYQNVFGEEIYPTIEEKAAHLLYFIVKDHPFIDGCKRIAATMFLEFLNKNGRLFSENGLIISNSTLVALTLLTAESRPEEKETIINVIMLLLKDNK